MDLKMLCIFAASLLFLGCCSGTSSPPGTPSGSQPGFCPYGTYGSACTDVCSKMQQGEGCFSTCMDWVRKEGLGNDATTCCKSTFRQWCQDMCTEYSGIPEQECMGDCEAQYGAFGISLDSCYVPV